MTQKRKNQREKVKASFATLLRRGTALQAIELAALKQNRLLYATCLFSVLRCAKEAILNSTPHCFARGTAPAPLCCARGTATTPHRFARAFRHHFARLARSYENFFRYII
ncbi:hypothetical protein [uncultured Bacteroides sp.]|uniref:hypothetical protein n=1 Tax=uncultured Bacteroides sp. TaxID=162156 RepID=UPI002AA76EAB|nr:hypothetical protein [uncultured Bacteroides sp.]